MCLLPLYIYIYVYTYTYTNTHTHTYTHTYMYIYNAHTTGKQDSVLASNDNPASYGCYHSAGSCASGLIYMCGMTLIFSCDMTHSYVRPDASRCVIRRIYMTHINESCTEMCLCTLNASGMMQKERSEVSCTWKKRSLSISTIHKSPDLLFYND